MGTAADLSLRVNFASRGARSLNRDLAELERTTSRLQRQGGRSRRAGLGMAMSAEHAAANLDRVGNAAMASLRSTVGLAADFEDQLARVSAKTTAGMDPKAAATATKALRDNARELGRTTRYTGREVLQGQEFLAMAGLKYQEQIAAMPGILSVATVGNVEVAQSADILTNIMSSFGWEFDRAGEMADRLSKALVSGNVNLVELGDAMSYAGAMASELNVEAETMLAWTDVLGDLGIKGSMAGTAERMILSMMAEPTKKGKAAFQKWGVSRTDAEGNVRDPTQILAELGLAMAQSGKGNAEIAADMKKMFGQRAYGAAMKLAGAGALGLASDTDVSALLGKNATPELIEKLRQDSLQARVQAVKDSDGVAEKMAADIEATTKGTWREFKSALEDFGLVIGDQALPVIQRMLSDIKPIIVSLAKWGAKHPDLIKKLTLTMMGVAAFSRVGAVAMRMVSMFGAVGGMRSGGAAMPMLAGGGMAFAGGGASIDRAHPGSLAWSPYAANWQGPMRRGERRSIQHINPYSGVMHQGGFEYGAGGVTWGAAGGPDMVRARHESAAQRLRARARARTTRAMGRAAGRGSDRRFRQQRAEQQRQIIAQQRAQRRGQRQVARASRNANFQSSGAMNKLQVASMGFAIGMAIGEGLNSAMETFFGRSLTDIIERNLPDFMEGGRDGGGWGHKAGRALVSAAAPGMISAFQTKGTDVQGTSVRGGAKFKNRTEAGDRKLLQMDADRNLARAAGVKAHDIAMMRKMGFSDADIMNPAKVAEYKRRMVGKAKFEQAQKAKADKRNAEATDHGRQARRIAELMGLSGEGAAAVDLAVGQTHRGKRPKPGETSPLIALLQAAMERGIINGVEKAGTLQALLPAVAEPVPTG